MNFDYSDDQILLRDEAARMLAASWPSDRVRAILNDPDLTYDAALWRQVSELGWLGIAIAEEHGGLGLDPVNLCALAEQLGRALAPIPFASTAYQFAEAIALAGSSEQRARLLPPIVAGTLIGCVATAERPGGQPPIPATTLCDGLLTGTKIPVIDGGIASHAIVLVRDGVGASLAVVSLDHSGVTRTPLQTLDPSRDAAMLEFHQVPCETLGLSGDGQALLRGIEDRAAVYFAFEQIGGATRAMEIARDYALQRYSFGRPIGSYQAIKHKLADMFIKIELARSNAYFGAWALRGDNPALPRAAAAARIAACEAYWFASKECVEIFGGIGTTLEVDCHLHYRRAKQLALAIGGAAEWRERLVTALETAGREA